MAEAPEITKKRILKKSKILVTRKYKEQKKADKFAALDPLRQKHYLEREAMKKEVLEKYGYKVCSGRREELSPKQLEGRMIYQRFVERQDREKNRDKIKAYQKTYKRVRRARALEKAQKTWTAEEWAKWEAKQAVISWKARFVRKVVRFLAESQKTDEAIVTDKLLEAGGIDFIMRGAETMGVVSCNQSSIVGAAARAVMFFVDPDGATMFPDKG